MISNDPGNLPEKAKSETLSGYTERLTDWYIKGTTSEYRKKRGQFFTPKTLSEFMVRQFLDLDTKDDIKILDPGAGIGIFESTFCEYVLSLKNKMKVSFILFENDSEILSSLRTNMRTCKRVMADNGSEISYRIINKDFILSNTSIFNKSMKNINFEKKGYDLIISNPPYYKLNKNSPQAVEMSCIMNGQPNIYPLFMALSAKLLRNNGQMVILTPRSYCSGLYFKKFRKWFFNILKPLKIHTFESRKEVFKRYNVLQENMILTAKKTVRKPQNVMISISNGSPNEDEKLKVRNITYDKIIVERDDDIIMRIPTSKLDESVAMSIDKFSNNLDHLGLKVSTGPVVPFRVEEELLKNINESDSSFPLIWMHNIINGMITWPIDKKEKPNAIIKTKESEKVLIPNKNYVLIKRFSSKEGKQRINAGIHIANLFNYDFIGIENHVNYIYKKNGELTINEASGLTALLNSRLYNRYFQCINGSTQVNASEINNIPMPSMKTIREIGKSIQNLKREDNNIEEKIIITALKIDKKIENELLIN